MFASVDADFLRASRPPGLDLVVSFCLIQSATTAFLAVFAIQRPEMRHAVEALVTLTSTGLLVASLFEYRKSRSRLAKAGAIYGLAAAVFLVVYWLGRA
ncbi:hypothetical protein [Mesorhizobium waimense]|nr:hypothetical protein [Mesorhizobium waimense]